MALVLKTREGRTSVGSNPTASSMNPLITPHRLEFLARRLLYGTANEGDLSEIVSCLGAFKTMLEAGEQRNRDCHSGMV